jgi:hypothetical protein
MGMIFCRFAALKAGFGAPPREVENPDGETFNLQRREQAS